MALESYLRQDYENRELIIVDDGIDAIGDLVPRGEGITHLRLEQDAKNLAVKRNIGIKLATGDIICHFDADDYSGPQRVSRQVEMLLSNPDAKIAGFNVVHWWCYQTRQASRFTGGIWGATFAYWKSYAEGHPWNEEIAFVEDVDFLQPALDANQIVACDGRDQFVAGMPNGNVQRFPIGKSEWKELWPIVPVTDLPEGFREFIH